MGPFDVSLCALILCGILAVLLWDENYGKSDENDDSSKKNSASGALKTAFHATIRSPDILSCGMISSLFEGSMYIFVFMWTPAMTVLAKAEMGDSFDGLPFGVIFSTFMVIATFTFVIDPHFVVTHHIVLMSQGIVYGR